MLRTQPTSESDELVSYDVDSPIELLIQATMNINNRQQSITNILWLDGPQNVHLVASRVRVEVAVVL